MSMNLTRCMKGHFYDGDTYASCPYCSQESEANVTVCHTPALDQENIGETVDLDRIVADQKMQDQKKDVITPSVELPKKEKQDTSTIAFWQSHQENAEDLFEQAPVVGWLVCVKGKALGQDFRLKSGRNFIGRGSDMDVALTGESTVSRDRHAIIIHEPRKNMFIVQPGESRELFYVNGEVVLSSVEVKKNDILQVGDVQLMLIPCCDEKFRWEE